MKIKQILYFIAALTDVGYAFSTNKISTVTSKRVSLESRAFTKIPNNQILLRLQASPSELFLLPLSWPDYQQAFVANCLWFSVLYSSSQRFLTPQGLLHATALGIGLWSFLGFSGWVTCVGYLALGTAVTKLRINEKEKLGIAEKRGGARGPENVWGSAATALLCAITSYLLPANSALFRVGYVSALATKLCDTFQSEVGKAYGKTTYLVTTLEPVPRGTEGAVSLEGTAAGVVGSLLIVSLGLLTGLVNGLPAIAACLVAAQVATTAESFIGATLQTKELPWLSNEAVNLINTIIGAAVGMTVYALWSI